MGLQAEITEMEQVNGDRESFFNDLKQDLASENASSARHYIPSSDETDIDLDDIDMDLERLEGKVDQRLDREDASLMRLRVEPSDEISFEEGQFISFQYQKDGDDRPLVRQYSIANSFEDYNETGEVELFVRLVEDGAFTPELFAMEEGDTLDMMPPAGHFTQDDTDNDTVMIATGTGVAPFIGMIDDEYILGSSEAAQDRMLQRGRDQPSEGEDWLLYGTRWEDDLGYKEELEELDDLYEDFNFVPTLSAEPDWDGERAYVQELAREYVEDGRVDDDADVYICGLGNMVGYTAQMLTGNQVDGADEIPEDETLDDPLDPDKVNFELYD